MSISMIIFEFLDFSFYKLGTGRYRTFYNEMILIRDSRTDPDPGEMLPILADPDLEHWL